MCVLFFHLFIKCGFNVTLAIIAAQILCLVVQLFIDSTIFLKSTNASVTFKTKCKA